MNKRQDIEDALYRRLRYYSLKPEYGGCKAKPAYCRNKRRKIQKRVDELLKLE